MEYESDGYTNCNWRVRYSHQRIDTETGELENKRMRENHPKSSIVEIGQKTETWGDLLSLKFQWETISQGWCEKLSQKNNV